MVARRLAGYAVAMEVGRRPEGPEVNGDLRKTVSRRSLVPSREFKGNRACYRACIALSGMRYSMLHHRSNVTAVTAAPHCSARDIMQL